MPAKSHQRHRELLELCQARLTKFFGVSKSTFPLHLKETEFCFNHRKDDLYKVLLSLLRKDPL